MHGHQLILQNEHLIRDLMRHTSVRRPTFIEVGSERGSGSTFALSRLANTHGLHFITIDADQEISERAREISRRVNATFEAVCDLAENFLKGYPTSDIVIIYMDAFDIVTGWPHKVETIESYEKRGVNLTNEMAWKMHYQVAEVVFRKIVPGGLMCFDDTWRNGAGNWEGKGKHAIPFVFDHEFRTVAIEKNCVLLQNQSNVDLLLRTRRYTARFINRYRSWLTGKVRGSCTVDGR